MKRVYILGVVALLLGGCASIETVHTNQTLLDEYKVVADWSAEEAKKQQEKLEQLYSQYPNDENRLRLAVVLGFSKGQMAQPKRAMELFKQTQLAGAASTGALAGLFMELLETRDRLAGTRWALKKEREKAGALEEKLQALTTIEKSLHSRD